MSEGQRSSKVAYNGQVYTVPASEGEKVIAAMTASVPAGVEMVLSEDRSLWIVVGAGIPVSVHEDRRQAQPARQARVL